MVIVYRDEGNLYAMQITYFKEESDKIGIKDTSGEYLVIPKETLKEWKVFF